MPPPSRDEPPPDPHGFRDVIARRRKAAEDDRDRIRSFERACASSRDDRRRTARALESTARHRHAAQLESLANALERAREVPPAFSPSLIAVRWLWRQLMDAKRLEEASELGAHASAVEEREATRHLATVDAENAARLASACVGHAKELQILAASLASCERQSHSSVRRRVWLMFFGCACPISTSGRSRIASAYCCCPRPCACRRSAARSIARRVP